MRPTYVVREGKQDILARVGKRKGRQRDTAFTLLGDAEFKAHFYDRRQSLSPDLRLRVEREAKARGLRNVQKRKL